jgi:Abnormal spindle-like microcephaly-assoc'd, ASPM-SPD-2-Hydin/Right handed beta helix region
VITSTNVSYGPSAIYLISGGGLIQGNVITNTYGGINSDFDIGLQIVGNLIVGVNGTGVSLYGSEGTEVVQQNSILENGSIGIYYYPFSGNGTFSQNVIIGNKSTGFVWAAATGQLTVVSNTIANNTSQCCGGGGSELSANPINSFITLQNNLLVATGSSPAMDCTFSAAAAAFTNNDIYSAYGSAYASNCPDQTGTNGNLSVDPLFADLLSADYHIQSGSPAENAGSNSAPNEPATDFDGDPRIVGGTIDIGADEYNSPTTVTLSAHTLHFGSQDVGTSSPPQTVTLSNNGKSSVQMNLVVTGPGYSQTNNCGTSLSSGGNCQINVTFSPALGGTSENGLGVFTGATTNPLTVTLVGTGLAPQIQLPCCFYFNNQVIYTSTTNTGTITNTGQAPLAISSIVYSGPSDFVESNNCPATLAVGASCTLSVTFTPTIVGNESGTITFNDNAPQNPQVLTINGSSVSAGIPTLNPTSLTFPTTLIGQSSAPQSATLTNTGTGPLGVTNIYSYGDFPETNNCPASLAVGASCTVTVTYTPSYQGNEFGYVYIYTDSASYNTVLSVTGTGQAPVPTLSSLSQTSVASGSSDTQMSAFGSGFVSGSQVLWNGLALGYSYSYGNTQINFTIPAADLITPGTYQISVFTPTPGGGVSNTLPFVVYQSVNYAVKSVKPAYKNITGTNLNLSYYQAAQISSPFPIQFGGGSYSSLTVASSGMISFNSYWSENNSQIPTPYASTLVAPFWMPLYPFGTGTDHNVFWDVLGSEPNRELVVEWRDVGVCCETSGTVTFEVVFFEGSSEILFNYADTIFGGPYSSYDNGAYATSGVQVSSSMGTQYSYDQAVLQSNTSLQWYPSSPTATVSTSSLSFGYHQIGSKSRPQKFTLTNGGGVALAISGITINNGDFQQTNNCGTSLAPSKSCVVHVVFDPSTPSAETATLSINDNATNSPQTVALSGVGSVTPVLVYPILANFGGVTVGQTGTVPVVLANAANKAMSVQQIVTNPSVYTQTNNCGTSVAPGASCTINVTFTPTQQGNVTGKLSMALNGKALVAEVKLVGSGR